MSPCILSRREECVLQPARARPDHFPGSPFTTAAAFSISVPFAFLRRVAADLGLRLFPQPRDGARRPVCLAAAAAVARDAREEATDPRKEGGAGKGRRIDRWREGEREREEN